METLELRTPPASLMSELQAAEATLNTLAGDYHKAVGRRDALAGLLRRAVVEVPLPAGAMASDEAPAAVESPQTIPALCREWLLIDKKLSYDLAALPEVHEDEKVNQLCDAARTRQDEIEGALIEARAMTAGEAAQVLQLTLKRRDSEMIMDEEAIGAIIRAVVRALYRLEGFPNVKAEAA